jgi:hypothetical protein
MARYGTPANPRRANPLREETPTSWRGLRKPGQESKIINRAELQAEYDAELAAQEEVLREKNANITGGNAAPMPTGSGGNAAPMPTGSVFSGVGGRSVGFSRESASTSPTAPRESFAETETRKRTESAASGAFGTRAQAREGNLAARRGLFAEMKAAAEGTGDGTSDFRERAKALGIDDEAYARGIARAEGTEIPKPAAPQPAAPLQGRALAQQNLRTMGVQGAAADYFKRAEAEKAAAQERRDTRISRGIAGMQVVQPPLMTQPVEPRGSFAAMFGTEANRDEPSPAMQQAQANTIAAREKADTMRAEYEAEQVRSSKSPNSSRPTPLPEPAPKPTLKPRGMDYNEAAVGKVKGATSKIDETIDTAVRRSVDTVSGWVGGLMSEARRGVRSARDFRDRTNKAGNMMGENLRKQLGIQ